MANKIYSSTGGLSNEITKMYGSIDGLSDNIIKGYCSVDGLSKLFFDNGEEQYQDIFWFYYSTKAEKIIDGECNDITTPISVEIDKSYSGIVFYFIVPNYNPWYTVITLSTDMNALPYIYDKWDGTKASCQIWGSGISYNNDTWYYGYATPLSYTSQPQYPNDYSPNCMYDNSAVFGKDAGQIITDYLLPLIYSNDFAEEYQEGQRYNLPVGDMEKTIRKYLAVYLYKNYEAKTGSSAVPYANVLEHVEDIVNYFMQYASGRIIELCADTPEGDSWGIRFIAYYGDANLDNILVENRTDGYEGYSNCSLDLEVAYSSYAQIDFKTDGTITYKNQATSGSDYGYIGIGGYGIDYMNWSNIGLRFSPSPHQKKTAIYYSYGDTQLVFDKFIQRWNNKTWEGNLKPQHGGLIWTDGTNYYYSNASAQYVLNESSNRWENKTWNMDYVSRLNGNNIWTDGDNIYMSSYNYQYVLDKSTNTWSHKTWSGWAVEQGGNVWTDGTNYYYSDASTQYVLDKSSNTWGRKTWSNFTRPIGIYIWTDGTNYYHSNGSTHYILDKSTSTWNTVTFTGLTTFYGNDIWSDGDNIYYSTDNSSLYMLNKSTRAWTDLNYVGGAKGSYIWTVLS